MKIFNEFINWWNSDPESYYTEEYYRDKYIVDNRYSFPSEIECFKKEFFYPNHTIYLYKDDIRVEVCDINCVTINWYIDNNNIKNDIKYLLEKEVSRINESEAKYKQKEIELINNYEPINKE